MLPRGADLPCDAWLQPAQAGGRVGAAEEEALERAASNALTTAQQLTVMVAQAEGRPLTIIMLGPSFEFLKSCSHCA